MRNSEAFVIAFMFLTWFLLGLVWIWLRYKRHSNTIELIKTYVAQGKEPPSELLSGLTNGRDTVQGTLRAWKRVATFGSLALGFAAVYLAMTATIMSPARAHPFLVTAIIMAALTLGSLINAWLQQKHDGK
ncbi:MAG: hypothetical protein QM808_11065 [Steroidobacteraceae bacterium]